MIKIWYGDDSGHVVGCESWSPAPLSYQDGYICEGYFFDFGNPDEGLVLRRLAGGPGDSDLFSTWDLAAPEDPCVLVEANQLRNVVKVEVDGVTVLERRPGLDADFECGLSYPAQGGEAPSGNPFPGPDEAPGEAFGVPRQGGDVPGFDPETGETCEGLESQSLPPLE